MPDYARLARDLDEVPLRSNVSLTTGVTKQHLIAAGLALRKAEPDLFQEGEYIALKVEGQRATNAVAFARRSGDKLVVAVGPRLMFGLLDEEWPCGDYWADSSLSLPERGRAWQLRNVFDNQTFDATGKLELATILSDQPIALLV